MLALVQTALEWAFFSWWSFSGRWEASHANTGGAQLQHGARRATPLLEQARRQCFYVLHGLPYARSRFIIPPCPEPDCARPLNHALSEGVGATDIADSCSLVGAVP